MKTDIYVDWGYVINGEQFCGMGIIILFKCPSTKDSFSGLVVLICRVHTNPLSTRWITKWLCSLFKRQIHFLFYNVNRIVSDGSLKQSWVFRITELGLVSRSLLIAKYFLSYTVTSMLTLGHDSRHIHLSKRNQAHDVCLL